jgi:hypothetical protein
MNFSQWGPVTVLMVAIVVVVAVAGAAVAVVNPDALTFAQYLDDMEKFAIALGILGVGRGIHLAGRDVVAARAPR